MLEMAFPDSKVKRLVTPNREQATLYDMAARVTPYLPSDGWLHALPEAASPG